MRRVFALVAVALFCPAFGQNWNEVGDAPDLLPGQITRGVGSLLGISGNLDGDGDVDLYCIEIVDEGRFSATTAGIDLDTQLWLFDANGNGVTFDDDIVLGGPSALTSTFVTANGRYFLAISEFDRDAATTGGLEIWLDEPYLQERAPDGPGAPGPLIGWIDPGAEGGQYRIALTGSNFCAVPEPGTLAALGIGALALLRRSKR